MRKISDDDCWDGLIRKFILELLPLNVPLDIPIKKGIQHRYSISWVGYATDFNTYDLLT